jgi:prepilin-type N-terminal cleavage/methylation domain-containing protein
MTDRRCGFTLIELIVVISIIMVLAAMIIPGLANGGWLAKKAATKSEISNMETALALYESDYGAYPADDADNSSKPLVDALKGDSKPKEGETRKKAYYPFKPKQIVDGEYRSVLNKPFYYRENASETTKDDTIMKNLDTFDIWTSDGKKIDDGINNWD